MGCSNSTLSRSSQINKSSKSHKIDHCLSAAKSASHAKNYHNNKNFSIFIDTEHMIHCKVSQEYFYLCTGLHVGQRGWKKSPSPLFGQIRFHSWIIEIMLRFSMLVLAFLWQRLWLIKGAYWNQLGDFPLLLFTLLYQRTFITFW